MFSFRLRQLRENAGWTQEELAVKLNLTQSTIAYYENDRKKPTLENAKIIAELFNVSLDFLIGFTDNKNDVMLKEENNNYFICRNILDDIKKLSPQGKKDLENFIKLLQLRDKQFDTKGN